MININKFLNSEAIIPDLKARTKEEAIRALIDKVFSGNAPDIDPALKKELVYKNVMSRENVQTTGIGNGLAFPHARVEGWGKFTLAMAVARGGIDFASLDSEPARFIFLMISSPDEPYIILQVMAAIIRFLSEMGHGEDILKNTLTVREIIDRFMKSDFAATEQILARDIMKPAVNRVDLEASLEEVTRIMHLQQVDVLPVVDEFKKFRGEVSCLELFEYGMPDFFKQLNTISFVRNIDPFERYFRIKRNLKVKDVFIKGTHPLKKDMTLLEIIFEMTVKKKSKLFVAEDDGTLAGVIDRFCVIDKILFF